MAIPLPETSESFEQLSWAEVKPFYDELVARKLSQESVQAWLAQWSHLSELVDETLARLEIACTQNTVDQQARERKERFLTEIALPVQLYDQRLKEQLLESSLSPSGFSIPLRNLRTETVLFREANLPLLNEEESLGGEYMQAIAAQMVPWEGREVNIPSLKPVLLDPQRQRREMAWHLMNERQKADRERLHRLWIKGIRIRQQIAHNAGFENYRDYRWQQLFRFDYTPTDCQRFHEAVEQVIVPVASTIWEKRRKRISVESLRPWDIHLEARHRPFIFGRVNTLWDIITIFHETGHAFQVFEMRHLPCIHQRKASFLPLEFAEVASTSMELIGAMYLHQAGFCTADEEARLRIQHLERFVTQLFPLAVRGDAFQHWVYEHPELAVSLSACDEKWAELTLRYVPDIDWHDLSEERGAEWQQVRHFYGWPFYYIEYAFAALGALQVWNNYVHDPRSAISRYRSALSLGATRTVPELFEVAGVKFAFDVATLSEVLQPLMQTIKQLETRNGHS